MSAQLTLAKLTAACRDDAAFRYVARLQPVGGEGDKVFPPTYEGGLYALEERVIDGRRVPCVLLDSVQSQANRMEASLLEAARSGQIALPLIEVDFAAAGVPEVGVVTSLDAPHRMADAILRDSLSDGVPFRESKVGKSLDDAALTNAAGLFAASPTSLLFGLWDSAGPRGGLGTKFARAIVGEIVGVDIATGVRPSSRLDPLGIQRDAGPVYVDKAGTGWTLDSKLAKGGPSKPEKVGKEGKPSEVNHGNVTPALKNDKNVPHHGGVTFVYARQTIVVTLAGLRKLRFPVDGKSSVERDAAAHAALAALGICAATLAVHSGGDLRSRCALVPETGSRARFELVRANGDVEVLDFSVAEACALLAQAVDAAKKLGLRWDSAPVKLVPRPDLVALVKKSRDLQTQAVADAE